MTPSSKLIAVKLLHTAIWVVMASATIYAVAASLRDDFGPLFFVSVGLVGAETLVLTARRFTCPLTSVAERYTDDRSPTFDIYLPHWIAKYNIRIFATILVLAVLANVFVRL
jgi:hypothetical protein